MRHETTTLRKPDTIEHLYLDFDSFFASVEQQLRPELRGRPVGIIPSDGPRGGCIAASKEAKAAGIKGVLSRDEALRICPDIALVPQRPDIYRRAHNEAYACVNSILPVHGVKSIDEMTCRLDARDRADPLEVAERINAALAEGVGPFVTASIGFAANAHLAKIACKMDKPAGVTVWHPEDARARLEGLPFATIPGIGERMAARLERAGITTMAQLMATQPKQMRKLWGNVTGERLWHALHGYEIAAQPTKRGAIGHGRVLPAKWTRDPEGLEHARQTGRFLTVKAARRARREGWVADEFSLTLKFVGPYDIRHGAEQKAWWDGTELYGSHDDHACLSAFEKLYDRIKTRAPHSPRHISVMLSGLRPIEARQLDLLEDARPERTKWRKVTRSVDTLNQRYDRAMVTLGPSTPPPGGHAGGKIAFTRVPEAWDFW